MDIFTFELEGALSMDGCPLCRIEAIDEQRWMETFVREGYRDPGARRRFVGGRGFCPAHAELLLRTTAQRDATAVVAAVCRRLVDEDIVRLRDGDEKSWRGRRRARAGKESHTCAACDARRLSADRKCYFFCKTLVDEATQARYRASDGLCAPHFSQVMTEAAREFPGLLKLLREDQLERLLVLQNGLSEFERRRDYRYRHEAGSPEVQRAPRDALLHYAGTTWSIASLPARSDTRET
jgi:hypothetical protein